MRNIPLVLVFVVASIAGFSASRAEDWHDPSPHQIRFVTVQPGVKIETLDWGGTGRPLVLIAGAGGTAHTFDDFALLLTPHFHPFDSRPVATALRDRDLPAVRKIAENLLRVEKGRPPWVDPQPADLESFSALREWYHRIMRLYLPEAEFRQMQATLPDGRPSSASRSPDWVGSAIMAGRRAFHHIDVPALYIGAEDNIPADYDKNDPEASANAEAYIAYQHGWIDRRTARFKSDAPNGRLVILKGANHMVFASNPQDVLRESLSFADFLPP